MALSKALTEVIALTGRPTDARGLLPIAVARKIVRATKVHGAWFNVNDDDYYDKEAAQEKKARELQAAMLSLDDAAEVLEHLTRIVWRSPLHGAPTLVERFGAALLPWFAGGFKRPGLQPKAWDTEAALIMLGSPEAFELLLKAKYISYNSYDSYTRRPQGVANVADLPELDPKLDLDPSIQRPLAAFIAEHPQVAGQVVGARLAKNPNDKRLRALVKLLPKAALSAFPGGPPPAAALTSKTILAVLDAAAKRPEPESWPKFATGIEDDPAIHEYHALRLIGVRSRKGEDWGVVLERISGSFSPHEPTRINRYLYGTNVRDANDPAAPGTMTEHELEFVLDRVPDHQNGETLDTNLDGVVVKGPAGKEKLSSKLIDKLDLRPGLGCELEGDPGFNLRLRAYLALHPAAYWEDVRKVIKALGIADAEVIVDTHAFRHVVGATYKRGKKTDSWAGLPSKCRTFQSLADALVSRKKADFDPGAANVDVRLHATKRTAG
jgi:hypothetical protein